eukprot:872963-Prymnesium_polylepis.1
MTPGKRCTGLAKCPCLATCPVIRCSRQRRCPWRCEWVHTDTLAHAHTRVPRVRVPHVPSARNTHTRTPAARGYVPA